MNARDAGELCKRVDQLAKVTDLSPAAIELIWTLLELAMAMGRVEGADLMRDHLVASCTAHDAIERAR